MEVCQLYSYNEGSFECHLGNEAYFADQFSEVKGEEGSVKWLNFHSIDEKETLLRFFQTNKFDSLIFEDVFDPMRRPKLEEYDDYFFFSIRSVLPPPSPGTPLEEEQLSFIIGRNYLVSLQEKVADHFTEVRERIEQKKGKLRSKGSDFLLFRMLDAITDNYFEVVDYISEQSRLLEPQIIQSSDSRLLERVEGNKRRLLGLRKIVAPLKDIAFQLEKAESPLLSQKNSHYFNDLKESCLGVLDEIDSTLSLLDSLTNLYYAVQGQRMNEIMKVLTVVSAIFIPLTFLAGIYGMNFVNIPELRAPNGYFILLGAMFLVALILIVYFIRRGWLGKR